MQALCAELQIPDPSVDLVVAARYARNAYSGLTRRASTAAEQAASGSGAGTESGAATHVEEQRGRTHCAWHRILLDVSVAAPNIYLSEQVLDGREMSSVLLVRLGRLSIQDAPADHGAGCVPASGRLEAGKAAGAGNGNRYRLQVAQIGVDLMRNAKLPLQGGAARLQGERASIIDDTQLGANLSLELPDPTSSGSGELRRALDVQAELEAVNVHASATDLCDIAKIAASWSPRWSLAAKHSAESSQVLMSGWLLVKGVSKTEGWCWRWLRVHPTAVHCCKSEEPGVAPDQVFPLDVGPLSCTTINGIEILALQLESEGARAGAACGGPGAKELLMYAGMYVKQWQRSIRQAQISINALLDADASLVAMPEIVLATPSPASGHTPPRKTVSAIRCSMSASAFAVGLRSDEGALLLDCRLDQLSGSFARDTDQEWELQIQQVHVRTASRSGGLTSILSQRACADVGKASPPFLKAGMSLDVATRAPHVRVHMQAMDLCIDNAFVNHLLHVKHRLAQSLDESKGHWRWSSTACDAAIPEASSEQSCTFSPTSAHAGAGHSLMAVLSPRRIELALSPRNMALTKSGRCCSLTRSQAPSELFPAGGDGDLRKVALRVSFVTEGMSTECWDDQGNCVLKVRMSEVNLVQENYGDGSAKLTGSLDGLHILDAFAQDSLYDRILTVSEDADKIVKVEMKTYNFFAISYPGYDKHISLTINRPEITLLFRIFGQLRRYSALFGVSKEQEAAEEAGVKDSLTEGGPEAAGRGPTRMHIALEHPVLILPRSSRSHERIVADLGMIEVQNVEIPSDSDAVAPAVGWQIRFTRMKLETVSERGDASVVTENIDGHAKIGAASSTAGNSSGPDRLIEVSVGEVVGRLTDAQYALLLSFFGQNMTERYINPAVSSAVNAEPVEQPDGWDLPKEISFKQLSEQVQQALSNADLKCVAMQVVVKVEKLNVAIDSAGCRGLDASTSSLMPLLQAVGKHCVVQFVTYETLTLDPAVPEGDDLLWQLQATCATLQVRMPES